jgi:hypothetical protein
MSFTTIANIGFLVLFVATAGLGLWMWIKKKQEGGE